MAKKQDLIYPSLSYKLIGIAFNIHNKMGGGLREKAYEEGFAHALEKTNISFERQLKIPIEYLGMKVGNRFLDLLVNDKIVVELKATDRFYKNDIHQLFEYLRVSGLKLGILINFGKNTVKFKRIVNLE
jgi:GxxExxY protein